MKSKMGLSIALVVVLAVLLQVIFVFADSVDTPNKAVVEFAKAYYRFNPAMSERLCSEVDGDGVLVDQYIYEAQKNARDRGYSTFYLKSSVYHARTSTLSKDNEKAQIHLTADRKPPLKSFFTKENYPIDQVFNLVKEDGKWKICDQEVFAFMP
jgi:hypothetical protein